MKIQKKASLCILFLCVAFFLSAQPNLVPNPSFESDTACPTSLSQLEYTGNWYQPNTASSDYFHACNTGLYYSVPTNIFGAQHAVNNGQAYAGAYVYTGLNQDYREYMQTKLTNTLVAGQKYYLSFYVCLSESSELATDDIGAYLSVSSFSFSTNTALNFTPQVSNAQGQVLSDTAVWRQITGMFTATGGERYITIGNFKNDLQTTTQPVSSMVTNFAYAYYYVDAVCLSQSAATCGFTSTVGVTHYKMDSPSFYYNRESEKLIFKNSAANKTVKLFDMFGSEIKSVKLEAPYELDTSGLKKGCYFVCISDLTTMID